MDLGFWLLFLHLIGAAIWVGGHLVLMIGILPQALGARDPAPVLAFEAAYERIGMPALAVQVVTGLWLALRLAPDPSTWLDLADPVARGILLKLALLAATAALALHARLVVIPRIDGRRLPVLAAHVAGVTLIAVAFVWTGLSFRFGGIG